MDLDYAHRVEVGGRFLDELGELPGEGSIHVLFLPARIVSATTDIPAALDGVSRELAEPLGHFVPSHLSGFPGEAERV